MSIQDWITEALKLATPFGLAIAWLWNERRLAKKEKASSSYSEADRERAYSDRMEARLRVKEEELEAALLSLMAARMGTIDTETILTELVDADPGIMFVKRRRGPGDFVMVRVSQAYAVKYLGGNAKEYDGHTDADIWGAKLGAIYTANDVKVYKAQTGIHVDEPANSHRTGVTGRFVGRKFSVRLDGVDYIVGIGSHVD